MAKYGGNPVCLEISVRWLCSVQSWTCWRTRTLICTSHVAIDVIVFQAVLCEVMPPAIRLAKSGRCRGSGSGDKDIEPVGCVSWDCACKIQICVVRNYVLGCAEKKQHLAESQECTFPFEYDLVLPRHLSAYVTIVQIKAMGPDIYRSSLRLLCQRTLLSSCKT